MQSCKHPSGASPITRAGSRQRSTWPAERKRVGAPAAAAPIYDRAPPSGRKGCSSSWGRDQHSERTLSVVEEGVKECATAPQVPSTSFLSAQDACYARIRPKPELHPKKGWRLLKLVENVKLVL